MPHARIDMYRTLQPKMADISAAILRGMVTGFAMPADDLFQIFRLHDEGELVYSPTFPNQQRDDIVFIELVASRGYTDEQKQAAMEAIVDEVSALDIKRDNLLLVINEVGQNATWYAPEPA
jgi:hypothetical protein